VFGATLACVAFVVFADPVWQRVTNPATFPVSSTLLVAAIAAAVLGAAWWLYVVPKAYPVTAQQAAQVEKKRITIVDMFKEDHPNTLRSFRELTVTLNNGAAVKMMEQAYLDFPARAKFAGFYIPATPHTAYLAKALVSEVDDVFRKVEAEMHIEQGHAAQSQTTRIKELRFTGRVLFYHETALTTREQADIEDVYANADMAVEFVGPNHLSLRVMSEAKLTPSRVPEPTPESAPPASTPKDEPKEPAVAKKNQSSTGPSSPNVTQGSGSIAQFGNNNQATINNAPRYSATEAQWRGLTENLKPFAGLTVDIFMDQPSSETAEFSRRFAKAFQDAGVSIGKLEASMLITDRPTSSIYFYVNQQHAKMMEMLSVLSIFLVDEKIAKGPLNADPTKRDVLVMWIRRPE